MAYRGKKCMEIERQLRKKSLLDECDLHPQRRHGGGGWHTDTKQMRAWKASGREEMFAEYRQQCLVSDIIDEDYLRTAEKHMLRAEECIAK